MPNRKRIGLITICPESDYQQRVMSEIFSQCQKYNYDVVVFTPLAQVCNFFKSYLEGDLNIYEMINFDLLDGVIITPIPMTDDRNTFLTERLLKLLKEKCKCPVVSLDLEFGDYKTVLTDDRSAFYAITKHLIEKHHCRNISMLSGIPDFDISTNRENGFKAALRDSKLPVDKAEIYQGDFWYTSGENLAKRYISRELPLPDAIVCASDHMAIGLTNSLIKGGIKVPDNVIVTGYGAVKEATINTPPITSYLPDEKNTAQEAVNYLHSILSPNETEIPSRIAGEENLCIGATCGCEEDVKYTRESLKKSQIKVDFNYEDRDIWNHVDIGMLLESYMTEKLTGTETPYDCLCQIYELKYLLKPYKRLYLCLNENWLDSDYDFEKGYSPLMQLAMFADSEGKLHGHENHVFLRKDNKKHFELNIMLPALFEDNPKPQVFYFVPVHFNSISLGYTVLQNDLEKPGNIGIVFRNFIRNINNALEMSRTKNKIANLSEHDSMTGLMNRRGMEIRLKEMMSDAKEGESLLAIVIDMDGLKIINDTYGHSQGDEGIILLSEVANSIKGKKEICIRAGGDEFYLFGVGKYTEADILQKKNKFNELLSAKNSRTKIPVSASFGYAFEKITELTNCNDIVEKADAQMYLEKRAKKSATDK